MEAQDIKSVTSILESIGSNYPEDSDESRALQIASQALLYVFQDDQLLKFDAFLREFELELTKEQKEHLRRMGLSK